MIKPWLNTAHNLPSAQGTKDYYCNAANETSSHFGFQSIHNNIQTRINSVRHIQSSLVGFAVPSKNISPHYINPNHHRSLEKHYDAIPKFPRTTNFAFPDPLVHHLLPSLPYDAETQTSALSQQILPLHSAHETVETELVQAVPFEVFLQRRTSSLRG